MASADVDKNLFEVLLNEGIESAQLFAEIRAKKRLTQRGTSITPTLNEMIVRSSRQEIQQLVHTIREISLKPELVRLFNAKDKKSAIKIAENDVVMDQDDLVKLITLAQLFGFIHTRKHKEFVPEHLKNLDHSKLFNRLPGSNEFTAEAKKEFTKITQIFKERRQLNVHWFQSELEWHCFYFDFSDVMGRHYRKGDHIHYISHLWGQSSVSIWQGFDSRWTSIKGAHIRYEHDYRDRN